MAHEGLCDSIYDYVLCCVVWKDKASKRKIGVPKDGHIRKKRAPYRQASRIVNIGVPLLEYSAIALFQPSNDDQP